MTVQTDVLNQIAMVLRSDETLSARLRVLLHKLCNLPEYAEWVNVKQYAGQRFRLPRNFISPVTVDRRLLESLRLVVDDVLQVKLNCVDNGLIFMTDGLFVPAAYRVFPDNDESDCLMRALTEENWLDWATAVIDPATGCGHNALRVDAAHRFGLDISMRALSFAAVNSFLNAKPFSALAYADIERGIPLLLNHGAERTLFAVNMPFVIEPISGALARTSAGGENGYEKTVSAMRAIKGYASHASAEGQVRAVILTYSIGNRQDERWVVFEEAKGIFGSANVAWKLLENERLWRVNGEKRTAQSDAVDEYENKGRVSVCCTRSSNARTDSCEVHGKGARIVQTGLRLSCIWHFVDRTRERMKSCLSAGGRRSITAAGNYSTGTWSLYQTCFWRYHHPSGLVLTIIVNT